MARERKQRSFRILLILPPQFFTPKPYGWPSKKTTNFKCFPLNFWHFFFCFTFGLVMAILYARLGGGFKLSKQRVGTDWVLICCTRKNLFHSTRPKTGFLFVCSWVYECSSPYFFVSEIVDVAPLVEGKGCALHRGQALPWGTIINCLANRWQIAWPAIVFAYSTKQCSALGSRDCTAVPFGGNK